MIDRDSFELHINEIINRENQRFERAKVKTATVKYVAWIDIMGAANILSIDYKQATSVIGRLHSAVLFAKKASSFDGNAYPLVDGCYLTTKNPALLRNMMAIIFQRLAAMFILQSKNEARFMIRGAVAYGRVISGDEVRNAAVPFADNKHYVDHVLLGAPVAEAYDRERKAAPFGIWISESARQHSPEGQAWLRATHWHWWNNNAPTPFDLSQSEWPVDGLVERLKYYLEAYLAWCQSNSQHLLYPQDALNRHRQAFLEYFSSIHSWKPENCEG